ncbi:MAG: hypothetical protein ACFFAU_04775 [Candidatus Hodarchaeota archaeon]
MQTSNQNVPDSKLLGVIFLVFILFFPNLHYIVSIENAVTPLLAFFFAGIQLITIFSLTFLIIFPATKIRKVIIFILIIAFLLLLIALWYFHIGPKSDPFVDQDEAILFGAKDILNGINPYSNPTPLGNPRSPLPGAFILALPFALFSIDISYLMLISFLLFIVLLFCKIEEVEDLEWNFLLITVIILHPITALSFKYSFDYYLFGFLQILGLKVLFNNNYRLSSFIFGILMSSRPHYWLVYPTLIIYSLISIPDKKRKWEFILIITLLPILIILPFILMDPLLFFNYAPLGNSGSKFHASGFYIIFDFLISNPYLVTLALLLISAILSLFIGSNKQLIVLQSSMIFMLVLILQMGDRYEFNHFGYIIMPYVFAFSHGTYNNLNHEPMFSRIRNRIEPWIRTSLASFS